MSVPGVALQSCSFGGGWAYALNDEGAQALFSFYREPPADVPPIGRSAYIVEPQDVESLAEHLCDSGIDWTVE